MAYSYAGRLPAPEKPTWSVLSSPVSWLVPETVHVKPSAETPMYSHRRALRKAAVSYTHLTLPTICSV
eukprot:4459270-Prymnesium_polylepis.1